MTRHQWSAPHRDLHDTRRTCVRCGLIRVTRHEPGQYPWNEWHAADGTRLFPSSGTPVCETVEVEA